MHDLSMEMHSNAGRVCLCTLVDRKRKHLNNAVDVVELLRAPTDQVPNGRHLRVQHTFSLMTSSSSRSNKISEVVDDFWQHDGMVTVGDEEQSPQGFAKY